MDNALPRVAGVLVGDPGRDREVGIKLGLLLAALGSRLPLVATIDASPRGLVRLALALRSFRPDRRKWRLRFNKNPAAFRARSRAAAAGLSALDGAADVVLQIGCMLDARAGERPLPSVIYTDYTARLSARHPEAGRSPLDPRALERWLGLETRAYRRATHVCTRSEFVRANLIEEYGLAPASVTAIGGGVNFAPLPALDAGGAPGAPTALFVGRCLRRKGGDMLLRAFADARRELPDARLLLMTGEPIPSDLPLDGVTVLRPEWDRERLSSLYRRADLFVLPSRLETWGDVLLEAMAHGVPCLGVAGEAMPEIIDAGETGQLVQPDSTEELVRALVDLLSDRERLRRWGASARRRAERDFTWERVAERLAPLLESAARSGEVAE